MSKPPPRKRGPSSKIVSPLPQRPTIGEISGDRSCDELALDFVAGRVLHASRAVELLTPRQRQVLRGVIRGASNKQIARELAISPRTVELHRRSMMLRLHARTTADAIRIGIYAGMDRLE